MINLNELSEYALEVIKRLAAEDEKTQKNVKELIDGIHALFICRGESLNRGESLKKAPETYKLIEDFINDWPNIKAKRRYLAAVQKLKEKNCHE